MNEVAVYKPVNAVQIRRGMTKLPNVMGALTSIERTLFLASTAKTIAEYRPEELTAELDAALKWISKDIGYRATDEADKQYLVIRTAEILKRYYSHLTLKEFRMAFEMSITGDLDEFLPKGRDGQADRGHYQQFNAEYVCKILNAYKYKRAVVLKKAHNAVPVPEPERNEEAEKENSDTIRRECVEAYEYYGQNGVLPEMSPICEMLYYNVLSEAGLASEVEVTLDDQKYILGKTINEYARKGMVGDMKRLEEGGTDAPELQQRAFISARKRMLKEAFERMVKQGVQISDYIKYGSED